MERLVREELERWDSETSIPVSARGASPSNSGNSSSRGVRARSRPSSGQNGVSVPVCWSVDTSCLSLCPCVVVKSFVRLPYVDVSSCKSSLCDCGQFCTDFISECSHFGSLLFRENIHFGWNVILLLVGDQEAECCFYAIKLSAVENLETRLLKSRLRIRLLHFLKLCVGFGYSLPS